MDEENRTCRTRKRRSAEELNQQQFRDLVERALESQIEKGLVERFFNPQDGRTYYRVRQTGGAQEASCAPEEIRQDQIDAANRREEKCNERLG
jgi:hypothetical protein